MSDTNVIGPRTPYVGDPGSPDFQLEAFAHGVAFGLPVSVALRRAGFEGTSTTGYLLMKRQDVQAIIETDRAWLREKMLASREALAAQLDEDRELAYQDMNPSAAVSATLGKARLMGFMDTGTSGKTPSRIVITWGDENHEIIHPTEEIVDVAEDAENV